MRSPARAIAWEFRQRHRWGLIALAAYGLLLAGIKIVNPLEPENVESFIVAVVVPSFAIFTYLLAAFSFGLDGDLAARQSIYPARMFTLPVTTAGLAGWPMLYGIGAMAMLWVATRLFSPWPSGLDTPLPLMWPGVLAAAFLAWAQALTWMPYGLPGLRVIVAVLWLVVLDAVVIFAVENKVPEPVMVAFLAPQIPVAYLVAHFAVARARRGDVPDWRGMFTPLGQIADALPRWRHDFPSPARAQLWFEWRRHGRALPAMVLMVVPFELALLFPFSDTPSLVFFILFVVLVTPPFMAVFAAANLSQSGTPFTLTRPLTSTALLAAKLKMTILSTLAAWLLVLIAIPVALTLSDTWPVVLDEARQAKEAFGPRAVAIALLGFAVLLLATWKQLVQSLCIGLTGREGLIKSTVFVALTLLTLFVPFALWIRDDLAARAALWYAFPWILGALVFLKMSAAAWIATRLDGTRVLSDRTLVIGAASWTVVALALSALLAWITTPLITPYVLALVAILIVPLARLSAAPLALAWNRHR